MKTLSKLTVVLLVMSITLFAMSGCTSPNGVQGPAGSPGVAGVGITGASVNGTGHLVLTLSNGQTIDAGSAIGPQGPAGPAGATGAIGTSTGSATSFASIVPQVEPTIVRIDVTLTRGLASGSGTIIDNRGYIITNAHVISGGQSINVTLKDGTALSATVIGSDTTQDIAIIKLTTTRTDFPVMTLGTMTDVLVGEDVMTAGFPAGTLLPGPATFTSGIISALRTYSGANYVQIDAPVNPGNSGGCLITASGKMIGIPSAGITPASGDFEDINLAIPINQVSAFIAQYVK
jgi:serine protease Do